MSDIDSKNPGDMNIGSATRPSQEDLSHVIKVQKLIDICALIYAMYSSQGLTE